MSLHSNLVIFKLAYRHIVYHKHSNFTFQSGYIQISSYPLRFWSNPSLHSNLVIFKFKIIIVQKLFYLLYIPIWLYSNPYPIIPSIQAILNYIFCLPIYLQVQNDYLVYSLLLLISHLPLFYNLWAFFDMLP